MENVEISAEPQPDKDRSRKIDGSVSLDQWRGLALIFVLVSHGFFFTDKVHGIGRVGVNLFFFISGVLVFKSLSSSSRYAAKDQITSFWFRRIRRLYPALVAYIGIMLCATWWLQRLPHLPPMSDFLSLARSSWTVLLYLVNYVSSGPVAYGHLWSLSCEMQFYLIAPIIFMLGGTDKSRQWIVFGSILVILLGLGIIQPFIGKWRYHFEFAVWPMMLGFCFEFQKAFFERLGRPLVRAILWSSLVICAASCALMLLGFGMKILVIGIGAFLLVPCFLAYVHGCRIPGPVGESLQWIGERTYSIYLWQQPLTLCGFLPPHLHPIGALIAIPLGALSFVAFEKPFLSANRRKT